MAENNLPTRNELSILGKNLTVNWTCESWMKGVDGAGRGGGRVEKGGDTWWGGDR